MEKSKLIAILKTVTDSEYKEFRKFLESKSIRKTGGVYLLYEYLKKHHPTYPLKKIDKAVVGKSVFKGAKNTEKRLIDTMSQMTTELEDFLVKKKLEENQPQWDLLLLEVFRDRKLDKLFFQRSSATEKKWEKEKHQGIEHLHDWYSLHRMVVLHPLYIELGKRTDTWGYIDSLDQYYFALKLNKRLSYHVDSYNVQEDGEIPTQYLIENILEVCKEEKFKKIPQINLLSQLALVFMNEEFERFSELKDYLLNNFQVFSSDEIFDIVDALTRICYVNYQNGSPNALRDFFELNRFSAQQRLIIEYGLIKPELFNSYVNVACAVKEMEWAENFVEEFKIYLNKEEREDMETLCKAIISMNKHEYGTSIQTLAQVKFQNPIYGFQARGLQLKCYYEMEDYDELFLNLTKSFAVFLNRDQILSDHLKEEGLNFIHFVKKVKKVKEQKKKIPYTLYEQLNQKKSVGWKSWLKEKVEELGVENQ